MKFRSLNYVYGILVTIIFADLLQASQIYCENRNKNDNISVGFYHHDNIGEKIGIPWKRLSQKLFINGRIFGVYEETWFGVSPNSTMEKIIIKISSNTVIEKITEHGELSSVYLATLTNENIVHFSGVSLDVRCQTLTKVE